MDKRKIEELYSDGNQVMIVGGALIAISFVLIGTLSSDNPLSELLSFVFIAGIVIVVYGKKSKNLVSSYETYYSLIHDEHITSVYQLAGMVGEPVTKTIKNLRKINEKGWMKVYVNEMDGSIHYNTAVKKEPEVKKETNVKKVIIYCSACGGKNEIPAGTTGECKYCGETLVDESYEEPEYKEPEEPEYENMNNGYNNQSFYENNHEYYARQEEAYYRRNSSYSRKDKTTALLLCIFLGAFGVHRYYVGKIGTGVLYTFTAGLCYFGWFYDIYCICTGKFTDSEGKYLR